MKPCPHCGMDEKGDITISDADDFQGQCACGVCGPFGCNHEDGRKKWNSLPRALAWTAEPPTVVGWYFWRSDTFQGNGYESTVYVDDTKAILELLLTNKHKNIRFAGPIPMPKEPTP